MTTTNHVESLYRLGVSVLFPAKRFSASEMRFDLRKPRNKLVEVGSMRFDHRKACRSIVKVWRVRFDHLKA